MKFPAGDNIAMAGPWGAANSFATYNPNISVDLSDPKSRILEIYVYIDTDCVRGIQFAYINNDGKSLFTETKTDGGIIKETGRFAAEEKLIDMGGTFGLHHDGRVVIKSLTFRTNLGTYGPYGPGGGITFSLTNNNVGDDNIKVVGFFGMQADNRLDNLGVYYKMGADVVPPKDKNVGANNTK